MVKKRPSTCTWCNQCWLFAASRRAGRHKFSMYWGGSCPGSRPGARADIPDPWPGAPGMFSGALDHQVPTSMWSGVGGPRAHILVRGPGTRVRGVYYAGWSGFCEKSFLSTSCANCLIYFFRKAASHRNPRGLQTCSTLPRRRSKPGSSPWNLGPGHKHRGGTQLLAPSFKPVAKVSLRIFSTGRVHCL